MKNIYYSIGLMSGTSLDGLDIALCEFRTETNRETTMETQTNSSPNSSLWKYKILRTQCIDYNPKWKRKLQSAHLLSAFELKKLETEWTKFLVKEINKFVSQSKEFDFSLLDCISSHGHTIFHNPLLKSEIENDEQLNFTLQIGNGAMLAAQTGFNVVCDFRQSDVALGGQGAPLVPIGDELLFSDYDFCLNLGGIANISFNETKNNQQQKNQSQSKPQHQLNSRFAFDICPCNIVLNYLSTQLGFEYDKGGKLAKKGKIDEKLLQELNSLDFYKQHYPKSLGREWVEEFIFPLLKLQERNKQMSEETNNDEQTIKDLLNTLTYHSAFQIAESIKKIESNLSALESKIRRKILVTGGGTNNKLLINYLKELVPKIEVEQGNKTLIAYKEALIFAFLGVLRSRGEINTLASVTGAIKNSCGGSIYLAESEI